MSGIISQRKRAHGRPCPYCNRQMERDHPRLKPTRDHHFPRSKGGRFIVICCITCNGIKGDMLPEQWTAFMATYPGWWTMTKYDLRKVRRSALRAMENGVPPPAWLAPPRQGSPPPAPVIVPPELIYDLDRWPPSKLFRDPGVVARAAEQDARLRRRPEEDLDEEWPP